MERRPDKVKLAVSRWEVAAQHLMLNIARPTIIILIITMVYKNRKKGLRNDHPHGGVMTSYKRPGNSGLGKQETGNNGSH